jgi:hypothetical protein
VGAVEGASRPLVDDSLNDDHEQLVAEQTAGDGEEGVINADVMRDIIGRGGISMMVSRAGGE